MSLSTLLNLRRPLVCCDTETTGLDVNTARIVELGFQVHYPLPSVSCSICRGEKPDIESRCVSCGGPGIKSPLEYRTLINPGIPIPAETTEVHNITDAMVKNCRICGQRADNHPVVDSEGGGAGNHCETFKPWPTFKQLAANLQKGFTDCDFAGKNVRYDLQVLAAEFARAGVPWSIGDARIVDADRLEALLVPRNLSNLYKKYTGEDLVDAHSALVDAQATTTVIVAQLMTTIADSTDGLPRDLDTLHSLSFPGMIDIGGKFQFNKEGVPCFSRWGKFQGRPMKAADNGYWDWLLKSDFSAEVKHLAAEAKMGRFPERKK